MPLNQGYALPVYTINFVLLSFPGSGQLLQRTAVTKGCFPSNSFVRIQVDTAAYNKKKKYTPPYFLAHREHIKGYTDNAYLIDLPLRCRLGDVTFAELASRWPDIPFKDRKLLVENIKHSYRR